MPTKRMMKLKKEKGFVLALTILILLALSTFSVAMMGILKTNADNRGTAHKANLVKQAAEYGLERGRLWLVDNMSAQGTNAIVITNSENTAVTGDCLGLHGYTNTSNFIHYAYRQVGADFADSGVDSRLSEYTYDVYVQRIGNHTTTNGYNYIPTPTEGADNLTANQFTSRRLFYRAIACGYGPSGSNQIVPLQVYLSVGGDGATGNVARSVNIEGYFTP